MIQRFDNYLFESNFIMSAFFINEMCQIRTMCTDLEALIDRAILINYINGSTDLCVLMFVFLGSLCFWILCQKTN